jgi:hypothetical protein
MTVNILPFFLNVINLKLDVCGSVHHCTIHKEKSNKMEQCIKILLFHIYMKLNMFQVTHRPSSGAKTALAASGFHMWKAVGHVVGGCCPAHTVLGS